MDITPGTPESYREEALRRLSRIGYNVEDAVFFGSGQNAESYAPAETEAVVARDLAILKNWVLPIGQRKRFTRRM